MKKHADPGQRGGGGHCPTLAGEEEGEAGREASFLSVSRDGDPSQRKALQTRWKI